MVIKIRPMLVVFPLLIHVICLPSGLTALRDTPDEEMQKFIDECNEMVDMMQHCAEGWMDFEQEMIDSVDSFADRIIYTEGLIMDEADQILEMADRIVQTEELMFDVLESCSCLVDADHPNNSSCSSPTACMKQRISDGYAQQPLKTIPRAPSNALLPSGLEMENFVDDSRSELSSPFSLKEQQKDDERCEPMDQMIEVMDAMIDTFVVFNDDFLEVLSYMDQGIQDMGDRIVDTECLIMNMSVQIGVMADRIVVTEELAANMTESCCLIGDSADTHRSKVRKESHLRGSTSKNKGVPVVVGSSSSPFQTRRDAWKKLAKTRKQRAEKSGVGSNDYTNANNGIDYAYEDDEGEDDDAYEGSDDVETDDLMSHCDDPMARKQTQQVKVSPLSAEQWKKRLHLSAARLNENLAMQRNLLRQKVSPTLLTAADRYDYLSPAGDGPMPCDTWWNPFCCAAEMCADMMVVMIDMMGSGADAMTEVCEDIIDEIGKLADDIVHTEENIVLMGEEIGYMSNCIVVFIAEGFDFMEEFCPSATDYYNDPTTSKALRSTVGDDACVDSNRKIENIKKIAASPGPLNSQQSVFAKTQLREKVAKSLGAAFGTNKSFRSLLAKNRELVSNYREPVKMGGNPFTDFAEMFEAMFEMMAVGANMMEGQLELMNEIFRDLLDLGDEQYQLDGMVVDMSGDVTDLSAEVDESEGLMNQLTSCMSGSK